MSKRGFGIFAKVFLYTLLFLLITISITALVFAQQFKDYYDYLQVQHYSAIFQPLKGGIGENQGFNQIVEVADEFHNKNQAIPFSIENKDGYVIYTTTVNSEDIGLTNTDKGEKDSKNSDSYKIMYDSKDDPTSLSSNIKLPNILSEVYGISENKNIGVIRPRTDMGTIGVNQTKYNMSNVQENVVVTLEDGLSVSTKFLTDSTSLYKQFIKKGVFILFLLLCASIAGAVLFARGITNPIRRLADDTRKMACLEEVSLSISRRDEVGQLANDVHDMYEKLKYTISQLQEEIVREKDMEENQRYFFSAASHELKTPIAAASALLEGMIAGIGDYNNHPKYLRECLNMMGAQNRIIIEILEIVKLSDERIVPHKENVKLLNIIHSLLSEYTTLADKKEQSIIVDIPEMASCFTDRKMISNVFSNVMMNAIQNSPKGEVIRIWSEISDDNMIGINILNTNSSIDDETQAKLFQPFYRGDKARSSAEGRGGLGLSIVKKILDSLNITFALKSRDTDVIFWMEIPIYEDIKV